MDLKPPLTKVIGDSSHPSISDSPTSFPPTVSPDPLTSECRAKGFLYSSKQSHSVKGTYS
ncbi:BnaC04g26880D [Brassica napus]|uniref:(rape) hypothetical protein n=1 Tax=Brassica napus TaxID=3708 RepID=A0A078FJI2_BRANA|nr:unnamed protein product [Brassica napus]CDY13147.1 BnaC04g26880D [Brassica napus]